MASIVVENVSSAVPRLGLRPVLRRCALCVVFVAVCFFIFPIIVNYHTVLGSNFKVAASSVHVVKLVDEPSGDAFHTPEVRLAILDYIEGRLVERLHWNLTAGAKNLKLDLSCYYADTADVDGVRVMMNEASDVVCSSNKTQMFPMHSTWHCEMYPNTSSLSPSLVRIGETLWSSLAMSRDTFWSSNSSTVSSGTELSGIFHGLLYSCTMLDGEMLIIQEPW